MSAQQSPAPGWWQASDGRWYPPRPPAGTPAQGVSPTRQRYEYDAEVNKKSINMGRLTQIANARGGAGWRLAHAFEQDGDTVLTWERPV